MPVAQLAKFAPKLGRPLAVLLFVEMPLPKPGAIRSVRRRAIEKTPV